ADFQIDYPSEDFFAIVDKEAITKIISNLMTNATKYTQNMVHLSCNVSDDHKTFTIEVEDNGVGISKSDQQKIFSPFYQAQDNKPGTGIGLSIVEYLVNVHGGHISVESQHGKGSVFRVTIPTTQANVITKPSKPAQESKEEKPSRPVLSIFDAKQIVLITEDDEDMLRFLASNFKTDYTVITARNGREGLQQVTRHQVSLIISDWMMPEMDGEEFCKLLRADYRYSHIPFVMLTAKTDNESKTQGMNCGADTFIEKPFSMEYLHACIKNMIEIRHMLFQKYSVSPDTSISSVTTSSVDNELLLKMTQVIEDNLEDPGLNVGFLAEHLNISRSGLFAKIKAITDVTPNELIQIVRLKKAAQLIADKKYRINEVSYMVGFNSPSYFAKCFQKQFGVKPGEYAL
ncbi:MAG: ATP-binding protein, partial [Prevotella sp.]|nr:ATP-binding protein [Prevotella sp.]